MSLPKCTFEEITGSPYSLDEQDQQILADRTKAWENRQDGPRVGDFVIDTDGALLRFTHDWGDTIQTTWKNHGCGTFHLSRDGFMSYSGALDPGVEKTRLVLTDEVRMGHCWFFSHDWMRAHNGVDVSVPCRVYRLNPEVDHE